MTYQRGRMRLGAFPHATGHHIAAWRHANAQADACGNFRHHAALAHTAERGRCGTLCLADTIGVWPSDNNGTSRMARIAHFAPLTLPPGGLEDFVVYVIPELQRRGLFRAEHQTSTLRGNLGLRQPGNRFFTERHRAAAEQQQQPNRSMAHG